MLKKWKKVRAFSSGDSLDRGGVSGGGAEPEAAGAEDRACSGDAHRSPDQGSGHNKY